ncbi:MAG: 50S ribosomal protein L18 [Thermodesulfobacteriota bacterium]|jgi:large subunit ribosomal protein L18|nr:MAG: 50S ribosomal protein L18 [Thermodesulfobacteriota bacterium]
MKTPKKIISRLRRKRSIRKKVCGAVARPRLCVFRSAKHIYSQIINDETGQTLVAASTLTAELNADLKEGTGNMKASKKVGALLARRAIAKGIKQVIFDRNGFLYHGRIKALAEAAREGGLEF